MAKTNFTKVEEILIESLTKMEMDHLGKVADIVQQIGKPEMRAMIEKATESAARTQVQNSALIHMLRRCIKQFHEPAFYETIGIPEEELKALTKDPSTLEPEEWDRLREIRNEALVYMKEYLERNPDGGNETIIERERKKHINKRFNVRDKWLPLK